MALYLWFLCLCLLTVIASPLLFIFNESLQNGALTTVGFILILFTIAKAVDKTELLVLKGKAKTARDKEKKSDNFESMYMGVFTWKSNRCTALFVSWVSLMHGDSAQCNYFFLCHNYSPGFRVSLEE